MAAQVLFPNKNTCDLFDPCNQKATDQVDPDVSHVNESHMYDAHKATLPMMNLNTIWLNNSCATPRLESLVDQFNLGII